MSIHPDYATGKPDYAIGKVAADGDANGPRVCADFRPNGRIHLDSMYARCGSKNGGHVERLHKRKPAKSVDPRGSGHHPEHGEHGRIQQPRAVRPAAAAQ